MIKVKDLFMQEINSTITVNILEGITYINGKNGSGKTIFLDYLCNIRNYKKNCIIGNENLIYMRQNFAFYNRIKVREFIDFVYELCQVDNDFLVFLQENKVPFNIEKLKNTKLGLLSGGERRSIYLLVILSIDKTWYVLDEPFVNLDKEMKKVITKLIHKLQKQGKNFVITNHDGNNYFEEECYEVINFDNEKR